MSTFSAPPYDLLSTGWLGMLFLTYLSGTVAATFSGRLVRGGSQPLAMVAGIGLLMLGTLMTLIPRLDAIVVGLLVNAFGFFLTHSQAAGWVSRHAIRARASASSLYLVFYYAGARIGGFYLGPFWNWLGWPGVVLGALVGFWRPCCSRSGYACARVWSLTGPWPRRRPARGNP